MPSIPLDRLSLVVGVTGHRDIAADDEAPLRAAFGRVLEGLAATCPHAPLLVLSGLAAGADALAAEEALARNIPVIACLPMPVAEYENDFSPVELARFRRLLDSVSRVVITSRTRKNGYVATGRFIAQYSHLLVAFWDGSSSRGAGGTADVIDMRLTGRAQDLDVESIPYLPDLGPVEIITTPRTSAAPPTNPYTTKRLYPKHFTGEESVEQSFRAMLVRMDSYNVDLAETPAPAPEPGLQALMDRTDATANRLQRQTNRFQLALLFFAFLAAAVQIIGHIPSLAKVVGLAAAFVAYRVARKHDYENRYQDYRAIAEGLRVQSAWYCAGLRHKLVDNAYLRMQEGELQWIRMALRFFYLLFCEDRAHDHASHDHPVCRDWVRSQWRYYYRARRRLERAQRSLDTITVVCIGVGVACLVGSAIALGALFPCALFDPFCPRGFAPHGTFLTLQELLTVPLAMAAMLGAVFEHHAEKQNLTGNAKRYERMFRVFDRARRELNAIARGAPGNPQEIIYELGRAALVEHADWLIMRRDRPMKVVVV